MNDNESAILDAKAFAHLYSLLTAHGHIQECVDAALNALAHAKRDGFPQARILAAVNGDARITTPEYRDIVPMQIAG